MKVFYWAHDIYFHETYTWREINKLTDDNVTLVLCDQESKTRRGQGWNNDDISDFKIILLPEKKWLARFRQILNTNRDAIHVFSGFWRDKRFILIILYAIIQKIKVAIFNEPYCKLSVGYFKDENWAKSKFKVILRPIIYKLTASIIKCINPAKYPCILAVSPIARDQFIDAGFLREAIFPVGYFVPKVEHITTDKQTDSDDLRLIFLGSLIKRKGIDIAIRAIQHLNDQGYQIALDIYGPGDNDSVLVNNPEKIKIKGSIKPETAQNIISFYDFLILPSRHDGWGVVVNEAILAGVPVITSDNVGAKCIFENQSAGFIFSNEDVKDLMDVLSNIYNNKQIKTTMKERLLSIADNITPDKGAIYLVNIFKYYFYGEGVTPLPPWGNL